MSKYVALLPGQGWLQSMNGKSSGNKKLLGAPGIATLSKDATRGSWPCYYEQEATRSPRHASPPGLSVPSCLSSPATAAAHG